MKSFSEKQKEWFDGSMLGDGSLDLSPKSINARYKVERWATDKEYLLLEYDLFKEYCSDNCIREYVRYNNKYDTYSNSIYFRTLTNEIFTKEFERWYPNGIKCVPKDLILSKQLICSWIIDDGHIELYGAKKNLVKLTLATNDFTKDDVEFLLNILSIRYPDHYFGIHKNNLGAYLIKASNSATIEIIKDIQELIPHSMNRKRTWKDIELRSVRLSRSKNPPIDKALALSIMLDEKEFTTKNLLPTVIGYAKDQARHVQIKHIIDYLAGLVNNGTVQIIDPGFKKEKKYTYLG